MKSPGIKLQEWGDTKPTEKDLTRKFGEPKYGLVPDLETEKVEWWYKVLETTNLKVGYFRIGQMLKEDVVAKMVEKGDINVVLIGQYYPGARIPK